MRSYAKAESRNAESKNGVKRLAFKLVVFLLAGAIINVAVAWGIWMYHDSGVIVPSRISTTPSLLPANARSIWERSEAESWPPLVRATWTECAALGLSGIYGESKRYDAGVMMPGLSESELRNMWVGRGTFEAAQFECGLPLGTFSIELARESNTVNVMGAGRTRHNGFEIDGCVLPTKSLWSGFAINTIFYAVIVWMLCAVPGAVRWRVRIKRGQCASCAYSLRESASDKCPECGAAVRK
jgi:hypothetical protein